MDIDVREAGKTMWSWLPVKDKPTKPADMIFVLGNKSGALPVEAAKLFERQFAPLIIVSGGYGRLTKSNAMTEADRYLKTLLEHNVPRNAVILERESTNTGENINFTRKILLAKKRTFSTAIAVTTAMLSRRHRATLLKLWPSMQWTVHTPDPMPFEERISQENSQEFFDLMVGEVDRLKKYPARGFMVKVDIPPDVLAAQQVLVNAGYTRHLAPES